MKQCSIYHTAKEMVNDIFAGSGELDGRRLIGLHHKTLYALKLFCLQMIFGITMAKTTILSKITASISHVASELPQTIYNRLLLHLGRIDLKGRLRNGLRKFLVPYVASARLIIIDTTDVAKPNGRRFEALGKVRDGSSKDKKLVKGYYLVLAAAVDNTNGVIPLDISLCASGEKDFVSQNAIVTNIIDETYQLACGCATYLLDRGFDAFSFIRHFIQLNAPFILRVSQNRRYRVDGVSGTVSRHTAFKVANDVRSVCVRIKLREGDRLIKRVVNARCVAVNLTTPVSSKLYLIEVKVNGERGEPIYLLTNKDVRNLFVLERSVKDYFLRWKIEELVRYYKQQFGLEGFRVRRLVRLKNLLSLLLLSALLVFVVGKRAAERNELASLLKLAHRVKKRELSYKFFMWYQLADAVAVAFFASTRRLKKLFADLKKPPPHLRSNQLNLFETTYISPLRI